MDIPFTFLLSEKAKVKRKDFHCDLFIARISRYTTKSPLSISLKAKRSFVVFFYVLKGSIKSFVHKKGYNEIVTTGQGQYRAVSISPGNYQLDILSGKNLFFYFILKNSLFHRISSKYIQLQILDQHLFGKESSNLILPLQPINEEITSHILKIQHSQENDLDDLVNSLKTFIDLVGTYAVQIDKNLPFNKPEDIVREIKASLIKETQKGTFFTLRDLIRPYPISLRTFFNYFKKKHGLNPREFIYQERMNLAHDLLIKGDMKAKEVSERLGYSNPPAFSLQFKKYFGYSPSQAKRISSCRKP